MMIKDKGVLKLKLSFSKEQGDTLFPFVRFIIPHSLRIVIITEKNEFTIYTQKP